MSRLYEELLQDQRLRDAFNSLIKKEIQLQIANEMLIFEDTVNELKRKVGHLTQIQEELRKAGFVEKLDQIINKFKQL